MKNPGPSCCDASANHSATTLVIQYTDLRTTSDFGKEARNYNNLLMNIAQNVAGENIGMVPVRKTFYDQFVGGDTPEEMRNVVSRLSEANVKPMIVCTMEEDIGENNGEDLYDRNLQRLRDCLNLISTFKSDSPLMQVKMTSIVSAELLMALSVVCERFVEPINLVTMMSENMEKKIVMHVEGLSSEQNEAVQKGLQRLRKVGMEAKRRGIGLLVDAEYSYINPGISLLAMTMMAVFNKESPLIWNTYQCYLKNALSTLESELSITKRLGVCFGAKLVRGAYISLESQKCENIKKECPVWGSYAETNECYNKALLDLIDEVNEAPLKTAFVAATHNEDSITKAIMRMKFLRFTDEKIRQINFAQLYGMCDQVTYPLAQCGLKVYKSVPYGPLCEALPYLARRATENQTVLAGARKERDLLRQALKERIKHSFRKG